MIAIVHADSKWGIGKQNGLMFDLPLDMKFFKETTMGKVVCMGYNTLLSLPNAKPFNNLLNQVNNQQKFHISYIVSANRLR